MSDIDRARAQRRRAMHERQTVVFGVILAVMAVAGVVGAAVFTGTTNLPFFSRGFSTASPEATSVAVPCLPEGTLPVPAGQITVNVLNGAGRVGLAGLTGASLTARGFVVALTENYTSTVTDTAVVIFGSSGIAQAYTLAAHVSGATLKFDATRTDATVDLVLGTAFSDLVATDQVGLDPSTPLTSPTGCVAVETLLATSSPAAS
ncbi:MAG: LytR C-terminal domain-containing protein [Cellulomonas sp.]|nr:LytR C-terminal domain-containing protein [Cellulomonas sp.]